MDGRNGEMLGADLSPVHAGRLEIRSADHAALVDGRPLQLTDPFGAAEARFLPIMPIGLPGSPRPSCVRTRFMMDTVAPVAG